MIKYFYLFHAQKGQALLLVVLLMATALTIGLSALSRSIINARITTEDEESQRALSAAEAGIQSALASSSGPTLQFATNNSHASVNFLTVGGTGTGNPVLINNGDLIPADQGVDVWLVSHDASGKPLYTPSEPGYTSPPSSGSMTIYWGKQNATDCSGTSTTNAPALEVVLLSGTTPATAVSSHYVVDPCPGRNNNFTTGGLPVVSNTSGSSSFIFTDSNTNKVTLQYSAQVPITNGFLMRIIPLYFDSPICVIVPSSFTLPKQGVVITSTGSSGPGAPTNQGIVQRKLVYYQGYPQLPMELFPFILFVNPSSS